MNLYLDIHFLSPIEALLRGLLLQQTRVDVSNEALKLFAKYLETGKLNDEQAILHMELEDYSPFLSHDKLDSSAREKFLDGLGNSIIQYFDQTVHALVF